MNLYSNKQKWKIALLVIALLMVGASLFVSNRIVNEVAKREREKVTQWADAIKKRAELVRLTNDSFEELRNKELNEMQLWIDATKEISKKSPLNGNISYDFPFKIINQNKDIPVIVLDQDKNVSTFINLDFSKDDLKIHFPDKNDQEIDSLFNDSLVKLTGIWDKKNPSFTVEVYDDLFMSYFYSDSRNIIHLENERDSLINAFNNELIENADLVPVIITDSLHQTVIATNLPAEKTDSIHLAQTLKQLSIENKPIDIHFSENETSYVYYATSPELTQLRYFPYIQFLMIGLFVLIGYIIFSTFRKAEQNQVWAGMAKETAHQLGTPISSLMAWVQLLEAKEETQEIATEMNKDVERLTLVTDRFSKIGANTQLEDKNIVYTLNNCLEYLRKRFPEKVIISFQSEENEVIVPHNPPLIEWVVENICKNAVDAMEGEGKIDVRVIRQNDLIHIDISDNGKGMTPSQQRTVFEPGFTTKKRGWGLGTTLAKRIIHDYHKGKLRVLSSEIGVGTTFRITLS